MIFFDKDPYDHLLPHHPLEQHLPLKQGVRQRAALRLKSVHSLAKKSGLASEALDIISGLKVKKCVKESTGWFFYCSAPKKTKCQPLKEISELFLPKTTKKEKS